MNVSCLELLINLQSIIIKTQEFMTSKDYYSLQKLTYSRTLRSL